MFFNFCYFFPSVFRYSYLHVQRRDSNESIQSARPDTSGLCQGTWLSCFRCNISELLIRFGGHGGGTVRRFDVLRSHLPLRRSHKPLSKFYTLFINEIVSSRFLARVHPNKIASRSNPYLNPLPKHLENAETRP